MILTNKEKQSIANMKASQSAIQFDDENRSIYQFKVEKPDEKEYRVSRYAIMCLEVKYFLTPEEVYKYIQKY